MIIKKSLLFQYLGFDFSEIIYNCYWKVNSEIVKANLEFLNGKVFTQSTERSQVH